MLPTTRGVLTSTRWMSVVYSSKLLVLPYQAVSRLRPSFLEHRHFPFYPSYTPPPHPYPLCAYPARGCSLSLAFSVQGPRSDGSGSSATLLVASPVGGSFGVSLAPRSLALTLPFGLS